MKKSIGTGRGSVYNIILKALQSGDKYGYEICKEIETKTNGSYILKQPSLYSGLKRLEVQNDVISYWGDSDIGGRRHYYSLTEKGRERIEKSNFSWEDSRNEIVENMFEKSELDSSIDSMKSELKQMSKDIAGVNSANSQIGSIIDSEISEGVKPLSPVKSITGHRVSNYQEDLFSFGLKNDFDGKTEEENSQNEINTADNKAVDDGFAVITAPQEKKDDVPEALRTDSPEHSGLINLYTEKMRSEQEKIEEMELLVDKTLEMQALIEEKNQLVNDKITEEKTENNSNLVEQKTEEKTENNSNIAEVKAEEEKEDKPVEIINDEAEKNADDFDNYFKNRQRSSFSDYIEERSALPLKREDLENSDIFYGSKLTEEKIEFAQKNDSFLSGSKAVTDNNSENAEIDDFEIRYQKFQSAFDKENAREEREIKEKETFMANSLSGDIPHTEPLKKEEVKTENINLKSIFSEFYDDSEKVLTSTEDFEEIKKHDEEVLLKVKDLSGGENQLPRYNQINNINLSLDKADAIIKRPKSTEIRPDEPFKSENVLEKHYDNIISSSPHQPSQLSQKTAIIDEKIPFDVKYAKMKDDFNEYKIRNHRKYSVENKVTRFISINKLNLAVYSIYSLISFLLTFIIYITVSSLNIIPEGQIFFYILCFIFPIVIFGARLLIYTQNKFKRIRHKSAKEDILNYSFFSVISIVLLFAFNMLFGMTLNNIDQHIASFVIPVIDIALLSLSPIVKSLLARNSYFSK